MEDSGHPFFQNRSCPYSPAEGIQTDPLACEALEKHVSELKMHLTNWNERLKVQRTEMNLLQLLSNQDIALIIHLLSASGGTAAILDTLPCLAALAALSKSLQNCLKAPRTTVPVHNKKSLE